MNIVVLAGGNSPERAVSLTSGRLVSAALRRRGHRVLMLDAWRGLTDAEVGSEPLSLFCGEGEVSREMPDGVGGDAPVGENVIRLCRLADVVFMALHGGAGENGQIQAMFDCFGIRYTGSGYGASFLAMDKPLCKTLLRRGGVLTADWCVIEVGEDVETATDHAVREIGFPCVVKPCDGGSSIGVTMAGDRETLYGALCEANRIGVRMMVEPRIFGRELTSGFLGDEVLPPVEITPLQGFYDYENKYIAGRTEEICPAPIGEEKTAELAEATRRVRDLIGLRSYSRADYILDDEGRLWFLEVNTLPGMTPTSLLPQEAAAVGLDYDDLCERIIALA